RGVRPMSNPGQDGNTKSAAFAGSAVPPPARTATPANVPARRIARESDIVRLLLRSDSPAVEVPRSSGATQTAALSLDRRPAPIARPTVTVPLADAPLTAAVSARICRHNVRLTTASTSHGLCVGRQSDDATG